jgi:hypothetical protein
MYSKIVKWERLTCYPFVRYSTTVIVQIKGKPPSLFCNRRTVIGKLMHIIIYNENKYVELICENKDVLFISDRGFVYCAESLKCVASSSE